MNKIFATHISDLGDKWRVVLSDGLPNGYREQRDFNNQKEAAAWVRLKKEVTDESKILDFQDDPTTELRRFSKSRRRKF